MQNTDFIETLSAKLTDGVQPAMDLVVENILNESDFAKYGNDEEDVYYKYSILLRASGFRPNEFENELRASVSAASDIAVTSNSKKGKALDRESLLCEVIEYLAKEYYNGHEKASDDSYDGLVMELRSINPKNPLAAGGLAAADDTGRKKFQHYLVTGTQQKYANMDAFKDEWFPQYGGKHRLMLNGKCDGAGSEVMYQDGKIVQAISRGDGFQGEDITQSALKWKGLIHKIPNFTGSIRGEFMLKESVFLEKYSQTMKTARNASSGLSKRLDGKGSEDMSFVAYDVLNRAPTQFKTELEKMQWLESCGFEVPMYELVDTLEQVNAFREKVFASRKKSIDYGCDGIVVKINDIDYDDLRRKTPMTQCAIKFELETAVTTLIGIEWSCKGRYLSPVAILEPTELDGVTVERASLSNLNKMQQMGIQIGCKVQISRHGEVIPQVDSVVK